MRALFTMALLVTLAGCVTTSNKLSDAAYRLDRSADDLYESIERDDRDSDATREARRLADAADEFNRDVKTVRSREELREEFDSVAKSYHELRDELDDEGVDSAERSAFADVTSAYLDLERELEYRRVSGL
jgi:hypothetical protein